jgi:hypothetical protein
MTPNKGIGIECMVLLSLSFAYAPLNRQHTHERYACRVCGEIHCIVLPWEKRQHLGTVDATEGRKGMDSDVASVTSARACTVDTSCQSMLIAHSHTLCCVNRALVMI